MPDWVNKSVFYHIYPLGFCGAPQFNNEDRIYNRLNKVKDWIPHLKDMNVTAINFGPLFESSEHGYDTKDYYNIDKRLGDNNLFKELVDELHKNSIRVIVDGVFNHVGRDFWAFKDLIQNGRNSKYVSWFENVNFNYGSPMGDPFTYEAWEGYYNLVKLNLKNKDVVDHILGAIGMWMDQFNIDGIRFDVAYCLDTEFIKTVRKFIKHKRNDFWLMGEVIHGEYFRWANKDMLDSTTNYECFKGIYSSHNDKNYFEIAYSLNRQFGNGGIYKDICTYNFVDNHDVNRISENLRDYRDIKNVYTLLYTMPGVPAIYYGSEWGIKGKKENGSDKPLRPCLDINNLENPDYSLYEHIKKLSKIKLSLKALHFGEYSQVLVRNEQLIYKRNFEEQVIFVALNLSDENFKTDINVSARGAVDLVNNNEIFHADNGKLNIDIPGKFARVLLLSDFEDNNNNDLPVKNNWIHVKDSENIKLGSYRHFKGNIYNVVGVGLHTETKEKMVIYNQANNPSKIWVRPMSMFIGTVTKDGRTVKRFEYLGK